MTKASDAFEQLQSRVFRLIESDAKRVDWNVRIADPDTDQPRQIDVLIVDSSDKSVAVECRLHSSPSLGLKNWMGVGAALAYMQS